MRTIAAVTIFFLTLSAVYPTEPIKFSLKISDNHRYFVDRNNRPFLYNAGSHGGLFCAVALGMLMVRVCGTFRTTGVR